MAVPKNLGAVLALVVLLLVIVLTVLGQPPGGREVAVLLGLLAAARLV